MKPFPNRTGIFQRIRLSIARALSPGSEELFSLPLKVFPLPAEAARLWSFTL
jgi:hypothetical protein